MLNLFDSYAINLCTSNISSVAMRTLKILDTGHLTINRSGQNIAKACEVYMFYEGTNRDLISCFFITISFYMT